MLQVGNRSLNSFVECNWLLPQSWGLVKRPVAQWTLTGAGKGATWWAVPNPLAGPFCKGPVLVSRVDYLQCQLYLGLAPLGGFLWGLHGKESVSIF